MICRSNKQHDAQTHEEITPDFHVSHYKYLQTLLDAVLNSGLNLIILRVLAGHPQSR